MEGSKFEDTENRAVIHWACTEFCSRRERYNFNYVSAGLCLKNCCHCVYRYVWLYAFFPDTAIAVHKF